MKLVFIVKHRAILARGIVEIEEQGLVEQLVAHLAVEALGKPFCIGFAGAMICQSMAVSLHQASMALQLTSAPWSDTIIPGLPGRSTSVCALRAAPRSTYPE